MSANRSFARTRALTAQKEAQRRFQHWITSGQVQQQLFVQALNSLPWWSRCRMAAYMVLGRLGAPGSLPQTAEVQAPVIQETADDPA